MRDNISQAIKALAEYLKKNIPGVNVTYNWPGPGTMFKFPALSVLSVSNTFERWQPFFLKSEEDNGVYKTYYQTGVWESRVDLHYFSKIQELKTQRDDQSDISGLIFELLQSGLKTGPSAALSLDYGDEKFQKCNVLLSGQTLNMDANIQTGFRRSIFHLILDIPQIITNTDPIVTDPQLVNTEISQAVDIR